METMFERTRLLLQRLTAGATSAPKVDRRAWERLSSDRETIIQSNAEGSTPLTARIRDVSRGGVRFLVASRLYEGEMIRIELPPLKGEPVTSVLACVVHVRPEFSAWSVGCSFATELSDDDMHCLGA